MPLGGASANFQRVSKMNKTKTHKILTIKMPLNIKEIIFNNYNTKHKAKNQDVVYPLTWLMITKWPKF